MTSEEFIKLLEDMLFKDDFNSISIGDTFYFRSVFCNHSVKKNIDYFTVSVNREALSHILESKVCDNNQL